MSSALGALLPSVRQVSKDQVPPGFWARIDHFSFPVTPLSLDILLGRNVNAQLSGLQQVMGLTPTREAISIDGYPYFGFQQADPSPEDMAALEENARSGYEHTVLRRWREETRPALLEQLRLLQAGDLGSLDDAGLRDHFFVLFRLTVVSAEAHFADIAAAGVVMGRCALFCREHFGLTAADLFEVLAGYSPISRGPVAALDELAAQALKRNDILGALDAADPWANRVFVTFMQPWLDTYGHRLLEFEFRLPTLAEQPHRVLRLLREAIDAVKNGDDTSERVRRSTQVAVDALRLRLSDDLKRAELDRLIRDAQEAYGVRDDDVGFIFWGSGLIRRALLEFGRRLAARGSLSDAEHVWYLRSHELEEALNGDAAPDLDRRAATRMLEYQRQLAETPAASFGTPPSPSPPLLLSEAAQRFMDAANAMSDVARVTVSDAISSAAAEDTSVTQIRGQAASKGTYAGIARVVMSEADFDQIQPGDVVVCPITSPSWNVVLGRAGAIVTDHGGILSHPAIIAREFGVPAVVATHAGTKLIPDGAMVEVDGGSGIVRLLH